jgi:hypothetical protein
MTDSDPTGGVTDEPAIEQRLERTPMDDFRRLFDLIALISSEKNLKSRVREFQRSEARAVAAQERLAADRAAHDAHVAKTLAELEAERAAVRKRQLDVAAAEGRLAEREQRYVELEKAWGDLKLPGHTPLFGTLTQTPAHTPLQKARFATEHGRLPEDDEVVTIRTDDHGMEFPEGLTRSGKRSELPAAVRPSRSARATP